jgi:predicted HicB family RNase H-like nuclease
MNNLLKCDGYIGAIQLDVEESILRGRIINIDDIVTFQGKTIDEVKAEFRNSVIDYREQCAASGGEPNKPFSGNLTLRINPRTHRVLDAYAKAQGTSLNGEITKILDEAAARYQALLIREAVPVGGKGRAGGKNPEKAVGRKSAVKAAKAPDVKSTADPGPPPVSKSTVRNRTLIFDED